MRQIFAIAVVTFSVAAIASGQEQGANRDPKKMVEQAIRKLDNERIQAQIHADAAALERIYADDRGTVLGVEKGRILVYHGWSDPAVSPLETVRYLKASLIRMGASREQFASTVAKNRKVRIFS